ncbi:mercury(II) reductase [Alteromonas sp. R78001]|uniref:mercury(II) reductase n=1 Tax=Alteromonas sp. R78001 TaxID=3093865 RepID=UPI00366E1357
MNAKGSSNCCASKAKQLHVAIIGSGSAAFSCAIKAAENGARVTIIEEADVIGGCCVNVGCVPSKILIRAAQLAHQQRSNPFTGIEDHEPKIDRTLLSHQQISRVDELRTAKYQNILENNPALTLIKGYARFSSKNVLTITQGDGAEILLHADKFLIATGSTPTIPEIEGLQGTPYWTSTDALFEEKLPKSLAVIGSSVVAVEIAQAYARLGCQVTILARSTLLKSEDPLLGDRLSQCFEKEGIEIINNTQVTRITHDENGFFIQTEDEQVLCEKLLISTGRHANTARICLDAAGVRTNSKGAVIVNEMLETNVSHIYAAGDCSTIPQYVYVAAAAGSKAGSNMTGENVRLDLSTMPAVVFTDPQVATVGLSERVAVNHGISVVSRVLEMENVPRALANFETDGFIKLVADKQSNRLIGAQILAREGGELVQSASLAIHNQMTIDDLANQLFPYLTMVEGLKLCAQTFSKDVSQLSCCAG